MLTTSESDVRKSNSSPVNRLHDPSSSLETQSGEDERPSKRKLTNGQVHGVEIEESEVVRPVPGDYQRRDQTLGTLSHVRPSVPSDVGNDIVEGLNLVVPPPSLLPFSKQDVRTIGHTVVVPPRTTREPSTGRGYRGK